MAKMGKDKTKAGVPNKHLHARISFLQQAATYLTLQAGTYRSRNQDGEKSTTVAPADSTVKAKGHSNAITERRDSTPPFNQHGSGGLPLLLSNHLTQVARKSQIRLQPSTKHQICKRCHTLLSKGTTSRKYTENLSKGGKKPQADMLVVECAACGALKRLPTGARRQKRKGKRSKVQPDMREGDANAKEDEIVKVDENTEKP